MLVTFDLDGVIAESDRWFFSMFNVLGELVDPNLEVHDQYREMELDYYASRPLKYHPNLFMAKDDTGYIITARKPHAKGITYKWLKRHGILLPIVYADLNGDINWWNYEKASAAAARAKADIIYRLAASNSTHQVHFDNNSVIVKKLRKEGLVAVLIGGKDETS